MAIYGHMTSKTVSPSDDEDGEVVTSDTLREVTAEASRDLEHVLSHLSESIDDLTTDKSTASHTTAPAAQSQPHSSQEPPPHFTLARSPTDRRGPDIVPPSKDPTIF